MLQNLAGFLLGQEDHFFLVLNLTSGVMINYCILFTFLQSINIWWQLETGYWVLTFLTYFFLSVESPLMVPGWCTIFLCSGYWQLYSGMKKFPLPLDRQGHRSLFRNQLLRTHGTCNPLNHLSVLWACLSCHQISCCRQTPEPGTGACMCMAW